MKTEGDSTTKKKEGNDNNVAIVFFAVIRPKTKRQW